jgi:hypothetical protein
MTRADFLRQAEIDYWNELINRAPNMRSVMQEAGVCKNTLYSRLRALGLKGRYLRRSQAGNAAWRALEAP